MKPISQIDSQEEIDRLQTSEFSFCTSHDIAIEGLVHGSLGVLAAGYQGIVAWRQIRISD